MAAPQQQRNPAFFWQGVFILLPVAMLAIASLVSLRQDEQAAERDARDRAATDVQSLVRAMASTVDQELRRYVVLQNTWMQGLHTASQPDVSGYIFPDAKLQADIQKWESDYSGLKLTAIARSPGRILADGRLMDPPDFLTPPEPPEWFQELTPEQAALWERLRAAEDTQAKNQLWRKFQDTGPSALASRASSHLLESPAQAAGNSGAFPSETGIAFQEIACARLLSAMNAELTPSLAQSLWWRVIDHPSMLSEKLLGLAAGLTNQAGPVLQQKLVLMRELFQARCAALEQFNSLRQLPGLQPWQKLWWSHWNRDGSVLALFQPMTYVNDADGTTNSALSGNGYEVTLVPRPVVSAIFNRALAENQYLIPPYVWPQTMVEGVVQSPAHALPSLGRTSLGRAEQKAGNIFAQNAIHFDVEFFLLSRGQMLQAERRRALMFGALVMGAVVAAFIGWLAARRAFYRQAELNGQKTNFVSSVSHELRAPIASVRLMAENLERGKIADPARQGEYFRFIVQECRRLSSLIENVLDFSRIEQGRKQYEFEPTDLVALTETTVKLMEPYAAEKGVGLHLQTVRPQAAAGNMERDVDGRAIQQALVNLIDNAVKHSPKGETVTVEINDTTPGAVHLSVSDHGPGIPATEHEKIFERFYRLGSELRRETQGVGIGLSVVKHIVEAHGGRVLVVSEIGKGSRFAIELPVKK